MNTKRYGLAALVVVGIVALVLGGVLATSIVAPQFAPAASSSVCPFGKGGEIKEIEEKSLDISNGLALAVKEADESGARLEAVLISHSSRLLLDSESNQFSVFNANGRAFILELIGASDTTATIRVRNNRGHSETREIGVGQAERVGELTLFVLEAGETNSKARALIVPGTGEFTLTNEKPRSIIRGVNTRYTVELIGATDTSATLRVTC